VCRQPPPRLLEPDERIRRHADERGGDADRHRLDAIGQEGAPRAPRRQSRTIVRSASPRYVEKTSAEPFGESSVTKPSSWPPLVRWNADDVVGKSVSFVAPAT